MCLPKIRSDSRMSASKESEQWIPFSALLKPMPIFLLIMSETSLCAAAQLSLTTIAKEEPEIIVA